VTGSRDGMDVRHDSMPVGELVASVQRAVARAGAGRTTAGQDLRVSAVSLTLRVVAARSGGAGLSFRVPFIGMQLAAGVAVSRHDTHTVAIALRPTGVPPRHAVRGSLIEDALASAIQTIRTATASAATGEDPWALSEATIDLEFAVERGGRLSLGAEGGLSGTVTHTLRLSLEPGPAAGPA
jgi:hypothetical protein